MTNVAYITNVSPIDRLGAIRAQIADLKKIEDAILAEVKDLGVGEYDGADYRATVSEVAERKSLDVKAAEEKLIELGVDGRWFSRNQKTTKGYTTVRVTARKS
jgi:hypothetical protein